MKNNYIGTVDKIRVIKTFPDMLVRFTLLTSDGPVNCVVANNTIGNQLLFFENGKTEVAVYGHANKRNQLVIEKMMIRNPSEYIRTFAMGVA